MKKRKGIARILAGAFLVVVLLAALFSGGETIIMGVVGPLTGSAAPYGIAHKNGIELALNRINRDGGINGRQISAIFVDDRNDKILAAELTRDLIYKDRVSAIIGSISSDNTMNMQRICDVAKIPMLTSASTNPFITRVNMPYTFRCLSDDNVQAEGLAKHTFNELRLRRVAVLHDSNKYGAMGALTYKEKAESLGQQIVAVRDYDNGDANFRNQLSELIAARPDGILIWGLVRESSLAIRQAREMGFEGLLFGGDGIALLDFPILAGKAAEGVLLTFPFNPAKGGSLAQAFLEEYRSVYKMQANSFAAHGYNAMMLFAEAIKASDGTPGSIRDALASIRYYEGVTGPGGFDETGNETRPVELARIVSSEFVPIAQGARP